MQPDAVIHDHGTFRILLRAMSRPGSVGQLSGHPEATCRHALLAGMLHCLMDNEVTHHVLDDPAGALSLEISRCTGSAATGPAACDFLIFPEGTSRGAVSQARRGTLEFPDKGATAVYLVERIEETGGRLKLSGPGIDGTVCPLISGPAESELGLLREANAEFPLGIDAMFLDRDGRILCIPRSTRIGVN
jgi:alpha-D-ribose 1-methylphosphonate 5-triphosphate synthase subunit PhnH